MNLLKLHDQMIRILAYIQDLQINFGLLAQKLRANKPKTKEQPLCCQRFYKVYYQMGNKQSKSYKPPSFKRENWHVVSSDRSNHRPEHGLSYLYRNNLTTEEIEEYQIYFYNQAEYEKYIEFFEWRERQDNIVNTKFINSEQAKQFCNTSHDARIYIEHVIARLSDIQDIPYPQNLYVLFSCLDGFEKLFRFVGYFRPEEDFICIDRDGRIKVWLNSDLSKCHTVGSYFSDQTSNFHDTEQYQQQMVTEIIEMIQKNTADEIEASMTFTQHLWKNGRQRLNFKQGKQEIINYAKINSTEIPNYFQSVLDIFNQDKPSELDGSVMKEQPVQNHQDLRTSRSNLQPQNVRNNVIPQNSFLASAHGQALHKTTSFSNPQVSKQQVFRPCSQAIAPLVYRQNSQVRPHSPIIQLAQHLIKSTIPPKVKFNYRGTNNGYVEAGNFTPLRQNQHQYTINTNFSTVMHSAVIPSQKIEQKPPPLIQMQAAVSPSTRDRFNSTVQDVKLTKKLHYSDTTQTYELDQQIVKDIIKYFG